MKGCCFKTNFEWDIDLWKDSWIFLIRIKFSRAQKGVARMGLWKVREFLDPSLNT